MEKQTSPEKGKKPETKPQSITDRQLAGDPAPPPETEEDIGEDPPPEEGIGHEDVLDL